MFDTLLILPMALPILGVLIAITVLASWRWAVAALVLGAAGLLAIWIPYWRISSAPDYQESVNTSLAALIIGVWSIAYTIAALAYGLGVLWWYGRADALPDGSDADAETTPSSPAS
jgi:hypothetical protein